MYTEFYELEQEPFKLTPDPQFFFLGEHQNKALAHLLFGINNRKGFIALTGEVGAGKTTLCRLLLKQVDQNVSVAIILNSQVDGITLLKQINRDFAIPYETDSHDDLVGYLYDFLISEKKKGRNVLIIVDECQNLKFEVLEQLRMLSNLETEKDKLLQILLIGQPEFVAMLNSYELRQLNQRITVRAHISALSPKEMEMYILHRLKIAGNAQAAKFTSGALRKIYSFSKGIPRKINVICDYALLAGYVENTRKITTSLVKKALQDIEVKREISLEEKIGNLRPRRVLSTLLLAACLVLAVLILKGPYLKDYSTRWGEGLNLSANTLFNLFNPSAAPEPVKTLPDKKSTLDPVKEIAPPPVQVPLKNELPKPIVIEAKIEPIVIDPPLPVKKEEDKKEAVAAEPKPVVTKPVVENEPTKKQEEPQAEQKITPPADKKSEPELKPDQEQTPQVPLSSKPAKAYFDTLDARERGIWLLLSTWGIEVNHPRRNEQGDSISLEKQLERFNFTLFTTWADLELLKRINLPCAVEILKNGEKSYWVLSLSKEGKLRFYTAPDQVEIMDEKDFMKIWQGNSLVLTERTENTLEGDNALYRGMQSVEVEKLKKTLFRMGRYEGNMDGMYDLFLEKIVKKFQKEFGLTEDGIIGVEAKLIFYSILSKNIPRIQPKSEGTR